MKGAATHIQGGLCYRVRSYFLEAGPIYEKRNSDYGMRKIWKTGAKREKEEKQKIIIQR